MTKKEILDFIFKLIKLLKPEFYNKIIWAVVIAGIALLSTSLIDKIISAIFEISFQIKLTDGNDAVIGIALVIIGLGYHLLIRKMEISEKFTNKKIENDKISKHDTDIFQASESVMDEATFKYILDWIATDHSYESDQVKKLDDYYFNCREHNNAYINQELEDTKSEFLDKLHTLREFVSYNFFVYPNNQPKAKRFCMHPEKNIDRGGDSFSEFYDDKTTELETIINEVYTAYVAYRKKVKLCLYI